MAIDEVPPEALLDAALLPLKGRRVAVPESRELDRLTSLIEARGAVVLRCPLVAILDQPDQAAIAAWLADLAAGHFDDLVLFTGEGLHRLMAAAERIGQRKAVLDALSRTRIITRGPKPARALTELGFRCDLPAVTPTTDGVIATLATLNLASRHVAVQLYGQEPNERLMDFLRPRCAGVHPVHPYIYAPATHDRQVLDLLATMARGEIDVVAFTSATQVGRLWDVAARHQALDQLTAALTRTAIAAVGPVVAQALLDRGVPVAIVPPRNFFMKPLVQQIAEAVR